MVPRIFTKINRNLLFYRLLIFLAIIWKSTSRIFISVTVSRMFVKNRLSLKILTLQRKPVNIQPLHVFQLLLLKLYFSWWIFITDRWAAFNQKNWILLLASLLPEHVPRGVVLGLFLGWPDCCTSTRFSWSHVCPNHDNANCRGTTITSARVLREGNRRLGVCMSAVCFFGSPRVCLCECYT